MSLCTIIITLKVLSRMTKYPVEYLITFVRKAVAVDLTKNGNANGSPQELFVLLRRVKTGRGIVAVIVK